MNLNLLKEYLDELWANVIDEMNINVFDRTIVFTTRAIDDGMVTNHKIIFEQVSSFYFLENTGDDRYKLFERGEESYLELTSIDFHPKGIGLISIDSKTYDWVKQYISNANFTIEIWDSMLFVETKRVVINNRSFDVGFPQ
ncbi:hypothetical protein GS18_0220420 [Metabacillus indicus]|uniref:Uncharacterized protein n=1 Tax=Metabacillus indicus TaxID=246786 RepID=A0A084GIQ0_METID|nr:hypothetical protein GS18_0220420 [Metabacillus indicus]